MPFPGGRTKRGQSISGAKATFVEPMKALAAEAPPDGQWHCEIKYDGYRAIALLNHGHAELWSRTHNNMSADYPSVTAALGKLRGRAAVLDGEIVALDDEGRSRFQLLQGRERSDSPPVSYTHLRAHETL